MAGYLAAGFPGDYYGSDLAKSSDFLGYLANQRQREEAFKNQQINRDMALEDLFHTQQMNPLVREGQTLTNRTREVQLPGLEAVSKKQVGEWDEFNQLKPERIKAALANYYQKTSEAEVKQEVAALQKAVLDPNLPPQVRKQLQLMLDYTPDNYKLNKTLQSREDVAQIRATRPTSGGSGGKPPKDEIAEINRKFANAYDRYSAFLAYAAAASDNDPNKARALAAAEAIAPYAEEAARNRVPAADWVKDEKGNWVRRQPAPLAPTTAPKVQPQQTAPAKQLFATNPTTGERVVSTDGGKTWAPVK